MFSYIWPLALVVFSNVIYQICAKSMPEGIHPLASLTISYGVGTVASAVLYFLLNKNGSLLREFQQLNWVPFALGFAIVGLEVGFLYAYRAGWQVSTASIVQAGFLAVFLVVVGVVLYNEPLTWKKLVGIAVCFVGLVFLNME